MIKLQWIVIEVFILVTFTLSRLRTRRERRGGLAVSGEAEVEENSHKSGPMQFRPMFSRVTVFYISYHPIKKRYPLLAFGIFIPLESNLPLFFPFFFYSKNEPMNR